MRGARSSEARAADQPFPAPSRARPRAAEFVSLEPLKALVRRLEPGHPLRILIQGEPERMSRVEFAAKATGWFRLLRPKVDEARGPR